MLIEQGRVVAIEADAVWVETIRRSTCGACAARSGCGHGVLARATASRGLVRAQESPGLRAASLAVDDIVDIALPEEAVLRGSLLVYGLPLILGLAAALLGSRLGEAGSVAGFVVGLAAGFATVHPAQRYLGGREHFEPRLAGRAATRIAAAVAPTA